MTPTTTPVDVGLAGSMAPMYNDNDKMVWLIDFSPKAGTLADFADDYCEAQAYGDLLVELTVWVPSNGTLERHYVNLTTTTYNSDDYAYATFTLGSVSARVRFPH